MKTNILSDLEKFTLTSELEIILSSGVSIEEGLDMISHNLTNTRLKTACDTLQLKFSEIGNFSEAVIATHMFDPYMEKMVYIGEQSGNLDIVMRELSLYYEREDDITQRMKEATFYPLVLLIMMTIIVALLVFKVLPIFQDVLHNMGSDLGTFSITMMNFGKIFALSSFIFLSLILILIAFFLFYNRIHEDKQIKERFLSSFFMSKKLYLNIAHAKLTYALSLFLSSGYSIEDTINFMPDFVSHPILKKKLVNCVACIKKGDSLSKAFSENEVYVGMHANMLTIGLQSGQHDEVLKKLVTLYEKETENATSQFLNMIEPVIIAVLSLIVGVILLSIMLPLMGIMSTLG